MQGGARTRTPSPVIPTWVFQKTRSVTPRGASRLKVFALAFVCVFAGFTVTNMLAPGDDPSSSNSTTDHLGTRFDTNPLESEAVMIESEDSEKHPWAWENDAIGKISWHKNPHDMDEAHGSQDRHALSKWQKNISAKLSKWYPSAWKNYSKDSNDSSRSPPSTENDTTNGTTLSSSNDAVSTINYTLGDSFDAPPGPSLYQSAPRIAKCTISFNYNPVYERALRTHDAHNQLHNYPLYINRESILDDVWTKPAWILALILRELARPTVERLQWLFWMDADTVVLNPHIPIETFLPPLSGRFDDVHLVIVHDFNGLNNGIFAIRVCRWSVQLLSAILAFPHYKPDHFLLFRDQSAMEEVLREWRFARHIVQAPQRWFNAYQGEHNETLAPFQVRRGDFLVHFPGVGDREQRMQYWLDRAEQHLPDWEIEYKQTSYPTEARDFWAEVAAAREAKSKRLENVKARVTDVEDLVQRRMEEYEDRLSEEEKGKVAEERKQMREVMDREETKDDPNRIEEVLQKLQEAAKPLNEQAEKAKKLLMKEAQDAIFKAQDTTMKYTGMSEVVHEVTETDEKLSRLKELVLDSSWKKNDVKDAIDELRSAHASLKEKLEGTEDDKRTEDDKKDEEVKKEESRQAKEKVEKETGKEKKRTAGKARRGDAEEY